MGELRAQSAAGDPVGAMMRFHAAVAGPLSPELGPETALGVPRKVHSAWLGLVRLAGDEAARTGLKALAVPPPELLAPLFAVTPAGRAARMAAAGQAVPRTLHQIWIGSEPPAACAVWARHAARHGWTHRLWDAPALAAEGIDQDPVFRAMLAAGDLPGAVDVARYHVLDRHGGVYLDCDWYPAREDLPLEAALPLMGLVALTEATPRVTHTGALMLSNALIAAPAGHSAIRALIEALPSVLERLGDAPAWWLTGPLVFTLAARGGPVVVLEHGFVAARFARETPLSEVAAFAAACVAADAPGHLIGWKGW